MIFRTPVETSSFLGYFFLEQKVLRLAVKCNEETYVYDHPNSLTHDAKSSSSQGNTSTSKYKANNTLQ